MLRETDPHFRLLDRALAGRYALERRLGRGGMGVVFLARELSLDRRVAIKLLLPGKAVDPVARERFLVEARTAAQLSHPNIVPIFAVDERTDVVFFAMAYVAGQTLGQRVRERGPLRPEEGARLLRDVGWALAHAHERGVVHRDVKPDNILLDAATGRALVSDFGIARVGAGGGTTGPREVVGTAEYMSPEQASGLGVDARSDLYSLGVVGYYALSGQLPFDARDSYEMLARHIAAPPTPLASVAPGVPRRLAQVIDRCLLKEPAARFTSGAHLADAVRLAVAVPVGPPLALRAFLVESRQLSAPALLYGTLLGLAVPLLVMQLVTSAELRARLVAAGFIVWLFVLPTVLMVLRVRRLRAAGFDRDDLTDALAAELVRHREELAFLYGEGPSRLERLLRRLAYAGVCLAATAVGVGLALLAAVMARARTEHRTDPKRGRRLRFWGGPLGRCLFRLAGLRLARRRAATAAHTDRPSPDIIVDAVAEGDDRGRELSTIGPSMVRYRPPLTARSLSPASRSCSSVLQNANRTSRRPSSGRLKKLEPGTGATPASHVSQRANASSGRSESAEKSARV